MSTKACGFTDCDRPHLAKGWCRSHYYQSARRSVLKPIRPATSGLPFAARFWLRVKKGKAKACWPWDGYGHIQSPANKRLSAALASWIIHRRGTIPKSAFVVRLCQNFSCVNPKHLALGTLADVTRGLLPRGEQHWKAKLKAADVLKIRSGAYLERYGSHRATAKALGVTEAAISKIKTNIVWRHCV